MPDFRTPPVLISLLLVAAIVASATSASAVNRFVRSSDGSDAANTCVATTAPCASLGHALSVSDPGDEIRMAGDFVESVTVDKPISIVGRSRAIVFGQGFQSCSGETGPNRCPLLSAVAGQRVMQISPGTGLVTLESLRIANVSDATAVAVDSGSFIVRDSVFRDNEGMAGRPALNLEGGVTIATVDDVLFEGNSSLTGILGGTAGAISSRTNLLIQDSTFRLNSSPRGAAVEQANGSLGVTNSLFEQNFASFAGGAIAISQASTTSNIEGVFRNNVAGRSGGAIEYSLGGSHVIQPSSLFEGNRVDSTDDNLADAEGGAIDVSLGELLVSGATFRANEAISSDEVCGETICGTNDAVIVLTDCVVEDSRIGPSNSVLDANGAITIIDSELELVRTTVRDNETNGVTLRRGALTAEDSTISGAGGAGIKSDTTTITQINTIDVNRSTLSGNAIGIEAKLFLGEPNVSVTNSTISGSSISNVRLSEFGTYSFSFSTIAGATAFEEDDTSPTRSLTIADSVVSGPCTRVGLGISLALQSGPATFWDDASCAPGPGLSSSVDLLPLADNGGPTLTHLLGNASPARDASSLRCLPSPIGGIDQRGELRPEGTFCDAGAVEVPEPVLVLGLAFGFAFLSLRQRMRLRDGVVQG